jgi:O-antigen ligase
LATVQLSPVDATVIVLAVLLVVCFLPALLFDSWTLRLALMLPLGVLGVAHLVRSAAARHLPSILLFAFVAWSFFSALLSGAVRSGLIGEAGRELSWITVTLAAGLWATGRTASERCRDALAPVLLAAIAVNALVGTLQVLLQVEVGSLALYFGRPVGFSVNPVYFGAISAAGASLGVALAGRSWWRIAATLLAAHGVALSGSRVAVGATLISCVALVLLRRERRVALLSIGTVAAMVLGAYVAVWSTPGSTGQGSRLASVDDDGRTQVWRYALDAFTERPVQGYGIGRFRPAVQGKFSIEFASGAASDIRLQPWFDPHNLLINVLVATGVVGTLLAAGWLVMAGRSARGAVVWAIVPIAITWSLQPAGLVTLPLVMLLLGAASATPDTRQPMMRRRAATIWLGVGALASAWLVVADVRLGAAVEAVDASAAISAARMYPHDPVVADLVAQVAEADLTVSVETSERWRRRPTEYEPDRPLWWLRLARYQILYEDLPAARESLARADELQPNSVASVRVAMELSIEDDDRAGFEALVDRACTMRMPECDLTWADVSETP